MALDLKTASILAGFDKKVRDELMAADAEKNVRLSVLESPSGLGGHGVYNVQVEGLLGDGTTDNRVKLQALIDKVALAGGGRIYFPPGRYLVSQKQAAGTENNGCIRIYRATPQGPAYKNITFEGAGPTSQIVMVPTLAKAVSLFVVGNGAESITFSNLRLLQRPYVSPLDEQTHLIRLWGNPTLALATGIQAGPKHVRITDCHFGFVEGDQVQMIGEENHPIINALIARCEFRGRLDENFAATVGGTRSAIGVQRAIDYCRIVDNYMDESDDQLIDFEPTSTGADKYFVIHGNTLNAKPGTTAVTGSGIGATTPNVGVIFSNNAITGGTIDAINLKQVLFINNHLSVPATPSSNAPIGFRRTVELCVIANNTIEVATGNSAEHVIAVQGDAIATPSHTIVSNNTLTWNSVANGIYLESCDHAAVNGNTMLARSANAGMSTQVGVAWVPVQAGTGRSITCTGNSLLATGAPMESFFNDGGDTGEVTVMGNSARGVATGYRQQNAPLAGQFPCVIGNAFDCSLPVSVTTGSVVCIGGNGTTASGVMDLMGPDGDTTLPNALAALNSVAIGSTYRVRGAGVHKKLWCKDAAGANGWTAVY